MELVAGIAGTFMMAMLLVWTVLLTKTVDHKMVSLLRPETDGVSKAR